MYFSILKILPKRSSWLRRYSRPFLLVCQQFFQPCLLRRLHFNRFLDRPRLPSRPTVFQAWLSACLFNALRRYAFWFFNCPPFLHNLHNSTSRSAQFQARSYPCKHVIAQCISYCWSPIFWSFKKSVLFFVQI